MSSNRTPSYLVARLGRKCRRLVLAAGVALAATTLQAEVRVELVDGSRILADTATRSSDGTEVELAIDRSGIRITRRIPASRVRRVIQGSDSTSPVAVNLREGSPVSIQGTDAAHRLTVNELATAARSVQQFDEFAEPAPAPLPKEPPGPLPQFESPPVFPSAPLDPPCLGWCRPRLDARILGVRDDPLSAYAHELAIHFPHGVPLSETAFALDLMRARKAQEVLGPSGIAAPAPFPPLSVPGVAPLPPPSGLVPPPFSPIVPGGSRVEPTRLEVRAFPVNSSGRADWDTLAIDLAAFDLLDRPAALEGTVQLTLYGQAQRLIRAHGERFIADPGKVELLGNWTRTVDRDRGRRAPVRIFVPLPRPLPDHDLTRFPWGELRVEIAVPGRGVIESTLAGVPLQHVSPLRDRQLVETGSRFFHAEGTTDSRLSPGPVFRQTTSLRPDGRVLAVQP